MSDLPEWLWPLEDEIAVQEAERLIDETHDTLRRMEADMRSGRNPGPPIVDKTEKLKNAVNKKLKSLEQELKVNQNPNSHPRNRIFHVSRPAQHLVRKTSLTTGSTSTAEKVVLTARAQVQNALATARNVSASLEKHASSSTLNSKSVSRLQTSNVGIFEVKSKAEVKNIQVQKPRLEQAFLPLISISRSLELQSIPSVQVPPGDKVVPLNVSVCNVQHEDRVSSQTIAGSTKMKSSSLKEKQRDSLASIKGMEGSVAELSKQLAEIEELREVNQMQVNHVLRFLLSRVCATPQTASPNRSSQEQVIIQKEGNLENKDQSLTSHSSSSSDYSRQPIAYDSLSRFLETYKKAAEQSMLAKRRASIRNQRVAAKKLKDIENLQSSSDNHLLIGPLRQTNMSAEMEALKPFSDNCSSSSTLDSPGNVNIAGDDKIDSNKAFQDNTQQWAEANNPESQKTSSSRSHDSQGIVPDKASGEISGEEYEDDWEEEEVDGKQKPDSSLQTITEAEEQLTSPPLDIVDTQLIAQSCKSTNEPSIIMPTFDKPKLHSREEHGTIPRNVVVKSNEPNTQPEFKDLKSDGHQNYSSEEGNIDCTKEEKRVTAFSPKSEQSGISLVLDKGFKPLDTDKSCQDFEMKSRHKPSQHRNRVRHPSSGSSSSDADVNFDSRQPISHSRKLNLKLREDLQLQSAILLNWQLEDRWKQKNIESLAASTPNNPNPKEEVLNEVEKRWKKTLELLDQRLKAIEEKESRSQMINKSHLQSREDQIYDAIKDVSKEIHKVADKVTHVDFKVPTKEQMVQTQQELFIPNTEKKNLLEKTSIELQHKLRVLQEQPYRHFVPGQLQVPSTPSNDLTAELIAYSRMGILSNKGYSEQIPLRSSSSSTSSCLQHSSFMVSLSDGEMRGSTCGSCSCSEGELCVCRGRKLTSERAPPDGSQTYTDKENILKDLSQGEILVSEAEMSLMDGSHGEITGLMSSFGPDLEEGENYDSDSVSWEGKENVHS